MNKIKLIKNIGSSVLYNGIGFQKKNFEWKMKNEKKMTDFLWLSYTELAHFSGYICDAQFAKHNLHLSFQSLSFTKTIACKSIWFFWTQFNFKIKIYIFAKWPSPMAFYCFYPLHSYRHHDLLIARQILLWNFFSS